MLLRGRFPPPPQITLFYLPPQITLSLEQFVMVLDPFEHTDLKAGVRDAVAHQECLLFTTRSNGRANTDRKA